MVKIVTLSADAGDPHGFRAQYFALRANVFNAMLGEDALYPAEADALDRAEHTILYLAVENNRVIGGARMSSRYSNADPELKFESRHKDRLDIHRVLLPHQKKTFSYSEFGALIVDEKFRHQGIAGRLYNAALQDTKPMLRLS